MPRSIQEILVELSGGQPAPVELTDVTVCPLAAAGLVAHDDHDPSSPPPTGATYVARSSNGRHLFVDVDEMGALRDAGAHFDPGVE